MIQKKLTARSGRRLIRCLTLTGVALLAWNHIGLADDGGGSDGFRNLRQEIQRLKSEEGFERDRVERAEKLIRDLENRLGEIEAQDRKLGIAAQEVEISNAKLRSETTQQLQELQNQVAARFSHGLQVCDEPIPGNAPIHIWGAAAGDFIYDPDRPAKPRSHCNLSRSRVSAQRLDPVRGERSTRSSSRLQIGF